MILYLKSRHRNNVTSPPPPPQTLSFLQNLVYVNHVIFYTLFDVFDDIGELLTYFRCLNVKCKETCKLK